MYVRRNRHNNNYEPIETGCNTCGQHATMPADASILRYIAKNNVPLALGIECKECMERKSEGITAGEMAESVRGVERKEKMGNNASESIQEVADEAVGVRGEALTGGYRTTQQKRQIRQTLTLAGVVVVILVAAALLGDGNTFKRIYNDFDVGLAIIIGAMAGILGFFFLMDYIAHSSRRGDRKLDTEKHVGCEDQPGRVYKKLRQEGSDVYYHPSYSNVDGNVWHKDE